MKNVHPIIRGALSNIAPPNDCEPKEDLLEILAEASAAQRMSIMRDIESGDYHLAGEKLDAIVKVRKS